MSGSKNIYVDLDSLLDTRLGTLLSLDPDWVKKNGGLNKYVARDNDLFSDEFAERYAKRDLEILKHSVVTNIPEFLVEAVTNINWGVETELKDRFVEISVNFWPYSMDEQTRRAITDAITVLLPQGPVAVKPIYISPELLYPKEIRTRWGLVVSYHFLDWVRLHQKELETVDLTAVLVALPKLTFEKPNEQATKVMKNIDPFHFLEIALSSKVGVRYQSVADFSIANVSHPLGRQSR